MLKTKKSNSAKLRQYVKDFGSDLFSTDGIILYCQVCEKSINADTKFQVSQHIETGKHANNLRKYNERNSTKQTLIDKEVLINSFGKKSEFFQELCKALLAADIPFNKLKNETFKNFLAKYTKETIPDPSTLRKNYLPNCYEETIARIREELANENIWISIDESTDIEGRYIANVIVGKLKSGLYTKPFLLTSETLDKTNHVSIAQLFNDALKLLWPNEIRYDNVLLFVTDAAKYMKLAAKGLKVLFPKMIHLTCLAHGMHRVAETVRASYPDVDKLISNVKKVFIKAPKRVEIFREKASDLNLPPQPIITRWGTWIDAVSYYAYHFESVKEVINSLDPEGASSIQISQNILSQTNIKEQLAYISVNFKCLSERIKELEKSDLKLVESVKIVENIISQIKASKCSIAQTVKRKLDYVLINNSGYNAVSSIAKILSGENNASISNLDVNLTVKEVMNLEFSPITSCDVERTFSRYKSLLTDKRRNYTFDNLKMTFVTLCNSN
jgi:hypothetical protein